MERRRQPRIQTAVFTSMRLFDPDRVVYAEIVDFSPDGMGLRTGEALPVESAVVLDYNGVLLLGEIVFCGQDGRWFRVGVRLEQALATPATSVTSQVAVADLMQRFQ